MGRYPNEELELLASEYRALMPTIQQLMEKDKEAALKKAGKIVGKIEKIVQAAPEGLKAFALLEKVKLELANAGKLIKRKDHPVAQINRTLSNSLRYFDIALKDFIESFEKTHSNINTVRSSVEDESDSESN